MRLIRNWYELEFELEMTKETFEKAKAIRDEINYLEKQQRHVKNMSKREKDAPFNELRDLAYEALDALIQVRENEFKKL